MKKVYAILTLLVLAAAIVACNRHATAQNAAPKLTEQEKLELRGAQVEFLQAQTALTNTKEYLRVQDAQKGITAAINGVYKAHKITITEYALCDGSGQGDNVCKGVPERALEFRAVPKAEPAKK